MGVEQEIWYHGGLNKNKIIIMAVGQKERDRDGNQARRKDYDEC